MVLGTSVFLNFSVTLRLSRHCFFVFGRQHQPIFLGSSEFCRSFAALLGLLGGLGGRLLIEGRIRKFHVKRLNLFLQLRRQGFDVVDLFPERRQRRASFGIELALVGLRRRVFN